MIYSPKNNNKPNMTLSERSKMDFSGSNNNDSKTVLARIPDTTQISGNGKNPGGRLVDLLKNSNQNVDTIEQEGTTRKDHDDQSSPGRSQSPFDTYR